MVSTPKNHSILSRTDYFNKVKMDIRGLCAAIEYLDRFCPFYSRHNSE